MSKVNLNQIDLDSLEEDDDLYDELYEDELRDTPKFKDDLTSNRERKKAKNKPRQNTRKSSIE